MSLSKRINGTVDKRPEEYSGEQENIIRQLKLLSRSQTALLKVSDNDNNLIRHIC